MRVKRVRNAKMPDIFLDVTLEVGRQSTVVFLRGDLTFETEETFKRILSLDSSRPHYMVINCTNLTRIDSTGLGALVSLMRSLCSHHSSESQPIRLCAVNSDIQILLEATRLNRCFPVFETTEQALASVPKKTVLVIDDSNDSIELLQTMLYLQGYEIVVANTQEEAETLTANPAVADLIILEPAMDAGIGYGLLKHLENLDIPVVVVSVDEPPVDLAQDNIRKWHVKPYDPVDLIETISSLIGVPVR